MYICIIYIYIHIYICHIYVDSPVVRKVAVYLEFGGPGTQFTCFTGTKVPEMAVYTALSPTKW